jgi:hypothetical protein
MSSVQDQCQFLKESIKLSTLEVQAELNLKTTAQSNLDKIISSVLKEYVEMLASNLDCIKKEDKT